MTLTAEQVVQAEACRRMLDDPAFQAVLDRIVAEAAGRAMFLEDERQREDNRRVVIAINLIRNELTADAEAVEADRVAERMNRAME
jgi:hypothetical protein